MQFFYSKDIYKYQKIKHFNYNYYIMILLKKNISNYKIIIIIKNISNSNGNNKN